MRNLLPILFLLGITSVYAIYLIPSGTFVRGETAILLGLPQKVEVIGAGSSGIDDTYDRVNSGIFDRWEPGYDEDNPRVSFLSVSNMWVIDIEGAIFYSNPSSAQWYVPKTGWTTNDQGTLPAPTIRY